MAVKLTVVHDPAEKNCVACLDEFDGFCARPAPYGTKTKPMCQTHMLAKRNAARRRSHRTRTETQYSLPPGGYDELKEFQAGRCGICKRASGKTRNLSVDHDHKHCDACNGNASCGKGVRGLLCGPCNMMLGRIFRDNPEIALAAYKYLTDPPYQRMLALSDQTPEVFP